MQYGLEPNRPIEALLHVTSFGRAIDGNAPRHWARGPTIAISRQVGARGATVARAVGARLGWPVYDHELLDQIAQDMKVRVELLERLDERATSWLRECLEALGGEHRVNACSYTQHLVQVLFSLAQRGRVIIVGRGAAHVLPSATTLRVRLVAALTDRIHVVAEQFGLDVAEAAGYVEARERDRIAFVKEHFHCDPADPLQYHLILNSSRFSVDECADAVVAAFDTWQRRMENAQRAASGLPAAAAATATEAQVSQFTDTSFLAVTSHEPPRLLSGGEP